MTVPDCARTWQGFVRANVDRPVDLLTLRETAKVGPLTLVPSTVVRYEPNIDALMPPGETQWLLSTPISVIGEGEHGNGNSHDPRGHARLQQWRLCSLLAVAWEQPWWPLHPPQDESPPLVPNSHLIDPNNDAILGGFAQSHIREQLPDGSRRLPDPGWNDTWDLLSSDRDLEHIARTYAATLRTLTRGPLEAEAALVGFTAILDAVGKRLGASGNSKRVRAAMTASYERHSCPELRANAGQVAKELHRLVYDKRCQVTHEAISLSLDGHSPGPLGDKPNDLDPGLGSPLNTAVFRALARQTRLAITGQLDWPIPEPGSCGHSPSGQSPPLML